MDFRVLATLVALIFVLSACFSSSSDDDSADRERAAAAASASVISGAVDDPSDDDDDDDDDGDGSGNHLSRLHSAGLKAMEICDNDDGQAESGAREWADVGSPYTEDGGIGYEWVYFQNCQQGTMETDGYQAYGETEAGAVSYMRWAGSPDEPVTGDGDYAITFDGGAWRFRGFSHFCDDCTMGAFFDQEAFMRWQFDADGEQMTFQYGQPTSPFTTHANLVGEGMVEQTIDGYFALDWEGTDCDLEINYSTIDPLVISDFETANETVQSGRLTLEMVGGSTYDVEFQNGQIFIDGELVDPSEPNACSGAFEMNF